MKNIKKGNNEIKNLKETLNLILFNKKIINKIENKIIYSSF
jgi:hypothetical protein